MEIDWLLRAQSSLEDVLWIEASRTRWLLWVGFGGHWLGSDWYSCLLEAYRMGGRYNITVT